MEILPSTPSDRLSSARKVPSSGLPDVAPLSLSCPAFSASHVAPRALVPVPQEIGQEHAERRAKHTDVPLLVLLLIPGGPRRIRQ